MKTLLFALLALAALVATSSRAASAAQSGYAPVNGLKLYYELHGPASTGQPPLVLLHGGGDTIETNFAKLLPELARTRRIIAVEQQGYGHTADMVDRPFSFEQSADDTAALLKHLGVERADVLGFSNGGTIALQLAIRHPAAVRKLVLAAPLARRDGVPPWFWDMIAQSKLENMPLELQAAYRKVAPQPENLRLFHDKAAQRMREFKDIPEPALRGIRAPAFIIVGDADVIRPEHAVELYRSLPEARLAVLPGTDHMALLNRTSWLVPAIEEFLQLASPPKK